MEFINNLILAPTEAHLFVSKVLLVITAFVLFCYLGLVIGGTLWSLWFNVLDMDTANSRYRWLADYLIKLAVPNLGVLFFMGVLPLFTLVLIFSQLFYRVQSYDQLYAPVFSGSQAPTLALLVAFVFIVIGLAHIAIYKKFSLNRTGNFFLDIAPGVAGLGVLQLGAFLMAASITLGHDPEKWPLVTKIYSIFLFSWNSLATFVTFLLISFLVTGTALLFFYFGPLTKEHQRQDEPISNLVRNFGAGLVLAACMGLPVIQHWNLITLPRIAYSDTLFNVSLAGVIMLAIVAVSAFKMLQTGKASAILRTTVFSLLFVLMFSALTGLARENATRDHNWVLQHQASVRRVAIEGERAALIAASAEPDIELGAEIYSQKCSACHAFDTRIVGPPYNAVLPKYAGKMDELKAFIANPVKVDPNYPAMPNQGLNAKEVASVAQYLVDKYENGK